jgi:hypothetical protein
MTVYFFILLGALDAPGEADALLIPGDLSRIGVSSTNMGVH